MARFHWESNRKAGSPAPRRDALCPNTTRPATSWASVTLAKNSCNALCKARFWCVSCWKPMAEDTMASFLNALALALALASPDASQNSDQAATSPDQRLRERIVFLLDTRAAVKKYDVEVEVTGSVATLNGDVASAAQKTTAGRLAKIRGVSQIRNEIRIDADADARLARRARQGLTKTGEKLTDAWISAKVRSFFDQEGLLK